MCNQVLLYSVNVFNEVLLTIRNLKSEEEISSILFVVKLCHRERFT